MNFKTLADLGKEVDEQLAKSKELHEQDGLYEADDITVYIDMYRKQIVKHRGSSFSKGRVKLEDVLTPASLHFKKPLEITRTDKFDIFPVIHLKEVRVK